MKKRPSSPTDRGKAAGHSRGPGGASSGPRTPARDDASRPPRPPRSVKPPLAPQPTTLWDYPSQHYGEALQGDPNYKGATPSYVVWNLLERFTQPKDLVVDPMAGSGTTLDVARDLGRRALGYDLNPQRSDIFRVDARQLPLEDGKADFVFLDPPYSTHVDYSDDPRCIGKLDAAEPAYLEAMAAVIAEIARVLKPDRYLGLYVSDSQVKDKAFHPIGFDLFERLRAHFLPVDIIAVTRHNRTLDMGNYRKAAVEEGFYLRGFNYCFILYNPLPPTSGKRPQRHPFPKAAPAPRPPRGPKNASRKKSGQSKRSKPMGHAEKQPRPPRGSTQRRNPPNRA